MKKQIKGLLALAVVGVAAYFILRQKRQFSGKRNATGVAKFQLTQNALATFTDRGIPASFKLKAGDIVYVNWRTPQLAYTTINGREATIPMSSLRLISL